MKIVNVTPGLLPIPPNGWGAVEKIIWEIHCNLLELGYDSQIKYLDEITKENNIVHIHVANLANIAYERGIPYYFTMHDHHAYLYGKDSHAYKENLQAIKNAKKAFVPAKYLVDWFEGIPEYFSHGVNIKEFTPGKFKEHKLLCVANNGFIHNQAEDRKGFGYAIEAAKQLNLSITIAGPSNNKNYFEKFPPNYDKIEILYDLSEEELKQLYKEHSIFLHPSILEAGHPNLTLLEAIASGLPIVGTFEKNNSLNGMTVVERDVNQIVDAVKNTIDNYTTLREKAINQAQQLSWKNRTIELLKYYKPNMKDQLIDIYNNTKQLNINFKQDTPEFNINFIEGAFFEIKGGPDKKYEVKFIDKKTNQVIYSDKIGKNCWAKASKKYFIDWKITANDGDTLYDYDINLEDQRVYIALDSKSLGDTLAWFPYVEEFRKKHKCQVICSTFWNNFFQNSYPEIEFVKPGDVVHNIRAMYVVGWFYFGDGRLDFDKNPVDFKLQSLQKTASDILGLEFKELKPIISSAYSDVLKYSTYDLNWLNSISKEIFLENEYNRGKISVEPEDIVLDLGANIGIFAKYALSKGASKVYAVEPYKPHYEKLIKNLEKDKSNILFSNSAMSSKDGYTNINLNFENNTILQEVYDNNNWGSEIVPGQIKTYTLENFCKENNIEKIDFLKLDIEGSEYGVFEATSVEFLSEKVQKIALEYHFNYKNELNNIIDKLIVSGFEIETEETNSNAKIGKLFAYNKKLYKNKGIISIAIHGTSQAKYWNNPEGWQQLVDYLKAKGYRVILLSQEEDGYMGNKHPQGIEQHPKGPIEEVIKLLQKSKMFIGIGSGLSWLSWAVGTPTTIISGFSYPYTETQSNTIRIKAPTGKCEGCFNTHRLDAGDWNWCPVHKGTSRQFECSKSITVNNVIEAIDHLL